MAEVGFVDKAEVDRWLRAYVEAWKSYDRDQIGELFSADVRYRYHPHDEPVVGRAELVQSWLGEAGYAGASARDEQGTYDAAYRAVAVDGDVAVATGSSTYLSGPGGPVEKVYDNCFVMRFDSAGRCREFTEWYVERPRRLCPVVGVQVGYRVGSVTYWRPDGVVQRKVPSQSWSTCQRGFCLSRWS